MQNIFDVGTVQAGIEGAVGAVEKRAGEVRGWLHRRFGARRDEWKVKDGKGDVPGDGVGLKEKTE